MTDPVRRLTSWKEIAAYLGREVRTVMRWEKERGLPVHRGSGGRSGVVFADTAELDAWTRGGRPAADEDAPAPVESTAPESGHLRRWIAAAATIVVVTAIGLGGWRSHVSPNEQPDRGMLTDSAIVALNAGGGEMWRHTFAGERVSPPYGRRTNPTEAIAGKGLLAATSYSVTTDNLTTRSGRLMWFDPGRTVRRSFSFEDTVHIGSRDFSGPWSLSDYQQQGSGAMRRIAVSGNHYEWWPSIVTVLDGQWQRRGSFIHAGWVERLRWLPGHRLVVSGFSNPKDGGMIALLDANALNGQSPLARRREFECAACGPDRPLRYVVMPRSEVNRASAAPFNRARFEMRAGALLVSTEETTPTSTTVPATAIYDFSPQLVLLHASYTDRYWEVHRELERLGKLTHAREQCPERDGPPHVEIWEPAAGWTLQPIRRIISR
jgi:hypothetical protein